jgi:hypothetical protein
MKDSNLVRRLKQSMKNWVVRLKQSAFSAWLKFISTYHEWKAKPSLKIFFRVVEILTKVLLTALVKMLLESVGIITSV